MHCAKKERGKEHSRECAVFSVKHSLNASVNHTARQKFLYNTGEIASIYYKDGLFVVANTSGKKVQVKAPMERAGDKVINMMTGATESVPSALTLEAYEYRIWKKAE